MTTRSKANGFSVVEKNVLEPASDHYVQTTPKFMLYDAIVGVNLRWYLANEAWWKPLQAH